MRHRRSITFAAIFVFFLLASISSAQPVPEQAERHLARGLAAVELAKSPEDLEPAIQEFAEAVRLAPTWPEAHYNLGLVQEKAGKFSDAVVSFHEYLRLAPDSPDAPRVRQLIYSLEYKAEQQLTPKDVVDILSSFMGWRKTSGDCDWWYMWGWRIQPAGDNSVRITDDIRYYPERESSSTYTVSGPELKFRTMINVCQNGLDNGRDCTGIVENSVKVVSKTQVDFEQKVIRPGIGAGLTNGGRKSSTFRKN